MKIEALDLREAREAMTAPALESKSVPENAAVKTTQALSPQLFMLGDPEDAKFQRITSPNTRRDLNPLMHERMQQVCFYLSVTTPFGKRIVEVISDYVVGEGFQAVATEQLVQDVIDRFWRDPVNALDSEESGLRSWSDELAKFGELCLPAVVNPVDGAVRLGYVDPQDIETIEYGTMLNADGSMSDVRYPVNVRLKRKAFEVEGRKLRIIRRDEDPASPTFGTLTGDCFYFAVNKAKGASRGLSDLFCLADWVDVFDQMMFDFADKVRILNAYVWDFTMTGADPKTVEDFKKKVSKDPPKQGGVLVHNEQVSVEAKTPDFKGSDFSDGARTVKLYGLGGIGMSPMFFADPIDANRSSAAEMEGPTGKKLTQRQNVIRNIVSKVLNFAIDQAVAHGVLPVNVDRSLKLQVPDLLIKDLQKAATTMQGVTGALTIAEDRGWIQSATAAQAFHVVLEQIGVEIDSKDEFAKAQEDKRNRDAQQQNNLSDQQALADAMKKLQGGGDPGATVQ